jgi:hypothetical protein
LDVAADAATAAAAPAPGIAPKPKRGKAGDFWAALKDSFASTVVILMVDDFVGPISFAFFRASTSFLAFSASSSLRRSYPSCLICSSSSFAFLSASSKLTGFAFAAPRPSFDFLGAADVEDAVEPEFSLAVPPIREGRTVTDDDVIVRGTLVEGAGGDVVEVEPLEKVLVCARPPTGVPVRGVPGADVFGVAGLDHDSKKSSSVSSFGRAVGVSEPSMWMPFGNLVEKISAASSILTGSVILGDIIFYTSIQLFLV